MKNTAIDIFTSTIEDQELSEYKILAALKYYSEQLHRNLLYPTFAELIEINNLLMDIINQKMNYHKMRAQEKLTGDLEFRNIVHENDEDQYDNPEISNLFDLVIWTVPRLREVLNEGVAIYDFVESQVSIKEVGSLPSYITEGYFLISDHQIKEVHVFKFKLSDNSHSVIPLKSLKTTYVDSADNATLDIAPDSIKEDLIKRYPELPEPATYFIRVDVDMPFTETILPVVKRKMMKLLAD
jgi:hypothetical protein